MRCRKKRIPHRCLSCDIFVLRTEKNKTPSALFQNFTEQKEIHHPRERNYTLQPDANIANKNSVNHYRHESQKLCLRPLELRRCQMSERPM